MPDQKAQVFLPALKESISICCTHFYLEDSESMCPWGCKADQCSKFSCTHSLLRNLPIILCYYLLGTPGGGCPSLCLRLSSQKEITPGLLGALCHCGKGLLPAVWTLGIAGKETVVSGAFSVSQVFLV